MKKTVTVLVVIFLSLLIFSCDKTTENDTEAPTVSITYPANNSEFTQGTVITIEVTADDASGIKEVKFYIDNANVATDDAAPYEYVWDTGTTKDTTHTIYAKAWDDNDNSGTSSTINVTLTNTVTDYDGNVYHIVKIGDQEWMMENLKVTHYINGEPIPEVTDNSTWAGLSTGAWCNNNNDAGNGAIYGHLYNWYTVNDSRIIAPEGWHVPTDDDLQILVDYLGGSSVAGGKMKETGTTHWNSPNTGATNESGFTALPGGYRDYYFGNFSNIGSHAYFWSSSEDNSNSAWNRRLYNDYSEVYRGNYNKKYGLSVRCIRTVE